MRASHCSAISVMHGFNLLRNQNAGAADGKILMWDLQSPAAPQPGPACAAPISALLYTDGWVLAGLATGGITGA